jgi:uncharacterized membrane protein YdbT with pleckstrin-like domain
MWQGEGTGEHGDEKIVFRGSPSQMVNFNKYVACVVFLGLVAMAPSIWKIFFAHDLAPYKSYYTLASKILFFVPVVYGISAFLQVKNHIYTITTERLIEEVGVLSKITDELELFRVKDITYVQPFSLRMFGCGNIILDTSDKSSPLLVIHAIKNARPVIELLRKNVQIMRKKRGVREIDY